MSSDQNSSSNLLHLTLPSSGPDAGSSGVLVTGREPDCTFAVVPSPNLATAMPAIHSRQPHRTPGPGVIPTIMQGFGGPYDPALVQAQAGFGAKNHHHQHRESMSSLPDAMSPVMGRGHRLSVESNGPGPYAVQGHSNSIDGSDTTSPSGSRATAGMAMEGIGENAVGSNSNETVNSHQQGDEGVKGNNSSGAAPAWSELKTKAGKERKRLPLACIACRRKKIRCSGEKPACKHCLRSRIPCVYKVTTRKAAPRTDYMAMLDKRLKRMEDRVIKIIPKEEQGVIGKTARATVKPALPPPPPGNKKRGADQAFGDEIGEWAQAKGPAASEPKEKAPSSREPGMVKDGDGQEHNLLVEGADKLPPKELQEHLSEVFFDFVYGQSYHLLHKPSFMRKLASGTVPPVLMLAVCAISARFSTHPAVRKEPAFLRGEEWAGAARDIALRRYDTPNITILIVYLILGLHAFGTCQGGRSWMFGGMAQRMAYALQLHQDLDHERAPGQDKNVEMTFTDREIRRRTMWSCFLMDRFNSSGTDRPLFVSEQYIRAQLPIKESYFHMEITGPTEDLDGDVPHPCEPDTGQPSDARENMGVAAYLIRLVAIWGTLIRYMNMGEKDRDKHPVWDERSNFQSIKRAADTWLTNLPAWLHYNEGNLHSHASEKIANQFLFMHVTYHQIQLFLARAAMPALVTLEGKATWPKDMPTQFIADGNRASLEHANMISTLVHEGMDHLLVAPFAGYCAYFSSTLHIRGAFSQNKELEASSKQNLARNVKYLTKMKRYWGMFHYMAENLKELYRKHADTARLGPSSKPSKDGDSIFQYGDWFDRYPHGVSGTDYEEPAEGVKQEPGSDAVLGQRGDLQTVEEFFSKMSPPSRAAHVQRKAPRKKTTKNSQATGGAGDAQSTQRQPQPLDQQQLQHLPNSDPQGIYQQQQQQHQQQQHQPLQHTDLLNHQFGPPVDFPHQQAFASGFDVSQNLMQQVPSTFSQLDRQIVLSSYTGLDPASTNLTPQNMHSDPLFDLHNPNPNNLPNSSSDPHFDPDLHAHLTNNNSSYWPDHANSSAWFMPFNMQPPTDLIGGDDNIFNPSTFDWQGGFGGLGDLPSTGLTPRAPGDLDTGQQQEMGSESGANQGLDHLGRMQ